MFIVIIIIESSCSSDYMIGYKNTGREVLCDIEPKYNNDNRLLQVDFSNTKDLAHCIIRLVFVIILMFKNLLQIKN